MLKGYKKLNVWKRADDLALRVYELTKKFPREEIYGLTSQLRRAVISIPTNIVEGCGRQNRKEYKHFINIALGSLAEVEYLTEFCCRLGFWSEETYKEVEQSREIVGAMLWKLHKSF